MKLIYKPFGIILGMAIGFGTDQDLPVATFESFRDQVERLIGISAALLDLEELGVSEGGSVATGDTIAVIK